MPIKKTIIFLIIAFAVVLGITFLTNDNRGNLPTPVKPVPNVSYTAADVALHADASSCWTIVTGNVYDLTPFVSQHPGGEANILKICGIDGTAAFTAQHNGQRRPANELQSLIIGTLKQ